MSDARPEVPFVKPIDTQPTRPMVFFAGVILVAAVMAAYANSFSGAMLLDDNLIVAASQTKGAFSLDDAMESARPVVDASFALNHAIGGLNPWGYHAVNLTIHLLATLVLFGLVRRSVDVSPTSSIDPRISVGLAFTAALLWGVHPLQTESVTYIIQRGESMMGLFYLLTLYCLARSSASGMPVTWQVATAAFCAMGMASKPVMVTAPIAAILYDRAFLLSSWREVFTRRWKLHIALAGTWLVLAALGVFGSILESSPKENVTVGFAVSGITPMQYLLTQAGVIVQYLRLAIWPDALCLDYQWPVAKSLAYVAWQSAIVAAMVAASILLYLRRPRLGFVCIAFFLALLPTSSFVPITDVIFEHRVYLSLASVTVLTVFAAHWILKSLQRAGLILPAAAHPIGAGLVFIVAASLAARTHMRNKDYQSAVGMWTSVLDRFPDHARARNNLAVAYYERGEYHKAADEFEAALRIDPNNAKARTNLAQTREKLGDSLAAAREYGKAARLQPESWTAAFNQGNEYYGAGRDPEAIEAMTAAKSIDPTEIEAYIVTGNALTRMNRIDEAIAELQDGIQLARPGTPPAILAKAHFNLANTLFRQNRRPEAIEAYREAVRLDPGHYAAHYGLGWALQSEGRIGEALDAYRASLNIKPDYEPALKNLETLSRLREGGG